MAAAERDRSAIHAKSAPGRGANPLPELPSTGGGAEPVDLDELSAHWRLALAHARDALAAIARADGSVGIPGSELRSWAQQLARERTQTARLLDAIAHLEHAVIVDRVDAPSPTRESLGLPATVAGCVFDLEGVLTAGAAFQARAWAEALDPFLFDRAEAAGERLGPFRPFSGADYFEHVHGRPRLEGLQLFLASRGIVLPRGSAADPCESETVYGLANAKTAALDRLLRRRDLAGFGASKRYLLALREVRLPCAVVSASSHADEMLERANLSALVDARIDANAVRTERLRSEPEPDMLLAACRRLGLAPDRAAAFETTPAGIAAARAARFALVVGVGRPDEANALARAGADRVLTDLATLLPAG